MKTIDGDLIQLGMGDGCSPLFDVIIHGCNCQCVMGAGIAKSIKQKLPAAFAADCKTAKGDRLKLGSISTAEVVCGSHVLTVVNAYTQFDWRSLGSKVDYQAIRSSMMEVRNRFLGRRIGYPLIGAGLAGGDWSIIAPILDDVFAGENHTLVRYVPS